MFFYSNDRTNGVHGRSAASVLCIASLTFFALSTPSPWRSVASAESLSIGIPDELSSLKSGRPPRNLDQLRRMEAHLQELSDAIRKCTVAIRVGIAHGSGVIVSSDGYVLTAAHVALEPGLEAAVVFTDGATKRAITLGMDIDRDAGMLKIESKESFPYLDMAGQDDVRTGQWCLAAGHPGGWDPIRGPVLRLGRVIDGVNQRAEKFIRTDCPIVGGDSGGPLVDLAGKVMAIHSRIGSDLSNNQHVPIHAYRDGWERLVAGDVFPDIPPTTAFIGVKGDPEKDRTVITEVYEGSPAEIAGIRVNDVIVSIDGNDIGPFRDLKDFMDSKRPGEIVRLRILRADEEISATVTLGGRHK